MSSLERHIEEVSQKIGIALQKTAVTTPSRGDCWYEATALLSRTYNVKNITAKQLRSLVIQNIEKCDNFDAFFEISCDSNRDKLELFKATHSKEGTFTDMAGEIVIVTALTLDVTIKIYSKS